MDYRSWVLIFLLFLPGKCWKKKCLLSAGRIITLQTARVRICFFRGDGGIFDPISHRPNYIIQTWELPENYTELNSNGLELLVYPAGRKSCDQFSNLKSNNALLYLMAAKYAKDQ